MTLNFDQVIHNLTAQYDLRLGVVISVLSAIPVLTFIYVAESVKFADFRQKLADCARRFMRFPTPQSLLTLSGRDGVKPGDGEGDRSRCRGPRTPRWPIETISPAAGAPGAAAVPADGW